MAAPTIKARVPATAGKGDIIEIKTSITHDMESGQRKDKDGNALARKIINRFACTVNGKEVFAADWHTAISANPYLSFFIRATESGPVVLSWTDDDGSVYTHKSDLKVG